MSRRQSTLDLLRACWSPFGSIAGPKGPKEGPPGELFKRGILDSIRTPMNSTKELGDFEVLLDLVQMN